MSFFSPFLGKVSNYSDYSDYSDLDFDPLMEDQCLPKDKSEDFFSFP